MRNHLSAEEQYPVSTTESNFYAQWVIIGVSAGVSSEAVIKGPVEHYIYLVVC